MNISRTLNVAFLFMSLYINALILFILFGKIPIENYSTTNGTITDFDGNFLLNANKGDIIIISFIGYRSQEAQAAASMNIILKDDTELLDEVVVIGYGSVKKDDLSGSVVAIKAEEMNKGAVTSPQELIMGKVPGLSVSQGDGAPGAGSTIRIRGGAKYI